MAQLKNLRLKERGLGVPGGFSFFQAETKHWVHAPHWWALVDKVVAHRRSNNLPVPLDVEREIEQQLCERLIQTAPEFVQELDQHAAALAANAMVHGRRWKFRDIANFTLTMFDKAVSGESLVDQAEADRRAEVCLKCPLNVPIENCSQCSDLTRKLKNLVMRRATAFDGQLQACQVCGCFNSIQVWFPLQILQRRISDKDNASLAAGCWKKK